LASRANLSRCSKLRQYWIIVMVRPAHIVRAPSMPFSGCCISVAIIFGIAREHRQPLVHLPQLVEAHADDEHDELAVDRCREACRGAPLPCC
jgi:hypothetical protein